MTSNSLTENEGHDISSRIFKTIFGLYASVIFRPKYMYVWFPVHLLGLVIPDPSSQLAELTVYITSTRVDLYSHQILLILHTKGQCEMKFVPPRIHSLWLSDAIWHREVSVNIGSGNGLLPDNTKPFPEPTFCSLVSLCGIHLEQLHSKCPSYYMYLYNEFEIHAFKITATSARGQ